MLVPETYSECEGLHLLCGERHDCRELVLGYSGCWKWVVVVVLCKVAIVWWQVVRNVESGKKSWETVRQNLCGSKKV